jgi:hypothetical protein
MWTRRPCVGGMRKLFDKLTVKPNSSESAAPAANINRRKPNVFDFQIQHFR